MQNNTKVSVIIPVKNAENKIVECLSAVFNQSLVPYEVIVVDGHSTDNTVSYASRFDIKLIQEEYGTVGGARKVGVENATGDHVAFTDADCIPKLDWLENLIKEFNEHVVGVGGATVNIGDGWWETSISLALDSFLGSANSVQDRAFSKKKYVKSISGCNSSYRKDDLIKIGNFEQSLAFNEDTELNKRLLNLGKIVYTPDAIVYHNQERDLKQFAKRIFLFGKGRAVNKLIDLQIIPPIIAMVTFILLFINLKVSFFMLALYLVILLVFDTIIFLKHFKVKYVFSVPVVFMIEHLSYTFGFWSGIKKLILNLVH